MKRNAWIVSSAILGLVAGCATRAVAPDTAAEAVPVDRVVQISAERFVFTPAEIRMVVGETVRFELTSEDTAHGFRIVGKDIDLAIPKHRQGTSSVVFEATEAGDYRFECSRICGAGHGYMRGVIRVTDPAGAA